MRKVGQVHMLLSGVAVLGGLVVGVSTAHAQDADLRLHMVQLQTHIQQGQMHEAQDVLAYIEENYPSTTSAHIARGSYEQKRGNQLHAEAEYQKALQQEEGNEDYEQLIESLKQQYDDYIRYDLSFRHEDNGEDHIIQNVSGRARLDKTWVFAATASRDDFEVETLQRTNGNLQNNFKGARHLGSFTMLRDEDGKNPLSGTVHLSDDVVGASANYTWLNTVDDYTSLTINLRQPFWDLIESQVDGGHRTGGFVEHVHQFDQRWRGNIGVGFHEYGIDGYNGVDQTIDAQAGLRYIAHQTSTLTFDVGYGLFGQYLVKDGEIAPLGAPFDPMGISSTELHNFDVTTQWQPSRWWRVENTLGYSVNRLGSSGSFGSLAITHMFNKRWEAQVRVNTALSTDGQADRLSTMGFYIQRRFN